MRPPRRSRQAVSFALRGPRAESEVLLYGEPFDWLRGKRLSALSEASGAIRHALDLDVPAGTYTYKFKLDGAWTLDPENARTRSVDGARNSVACFGGAPEPLLFAPALPWAYDEPGRGLVITAGVRKGEHDRVLRVLWREGANDSPKRTELSHFAEEDEHTLFRVLLPVSSDRAELLFELADGAQIGDEHGEPLFWERDDARLPSWFRSAIVYTIVVDRFRRFPDLPDWENDPGPDRAAGGNLEGIVRSLDAVAELGANTLYLTPVQLAATCHRYDLIDPLVVDPALGGDEAFERLIAEVHRRGMHLLLDFSFAHVGRGFAPYEDVRANGLRSTFAPWFRWSDGRDPELVQYGKRKDAPLLDLLHPDVRALVLRSAEHWAERGVDGFRFDAVAEAPHRLVREVRARLRARRPDGVVLGEVVPPHAWRWRAEEAVDAATDFAFHRLVTDFAIFRAIDAERMMTLFFRAEAHRGGADETAVRFVSTHDHPRVGTLAKLAGDPRRVPLALLLLLVFPGVPALLYGDEVGLVADVPELEPENAWGDRAPMPWSRVRPDEPLRLLTTHLVRARRQNAALREGDFALLHAEGAVLVVRRSGGGEVVDAAVNASDEAVELDLEDTDYDHVELLAAVGDARTSGQSVRLGANAGIVLRREKSAATPLVVLRAARDRDFVEGRTEVRSLPTRIDFAVTERCNLRCLHCIAHAPERTADGSARTLSRALLDRLRGDLARADYFGFVHGGEELTAPILFDVLGAIRETHPRGDAMVHLLTNGQSLSRATTERLVALGVRSLFVSLDGATAESNDRVRVGGSFARITSNIRAAIDVRRTLGADLRVGLSVVVLKSNVGELGALVELAKELGVDWLKLEEPIGSTDFAVAELVDCGAGPPRDAIAKALDRATDLGLVAVDHTRERALFRCRLDDDDERFLVADEFANRAEQNPCRAPWERACVLPNGDVAAGDFLRPVLGNIMEAPLSALWNAPLAQAERRAMRARWICNGEVCCTAQSFNSRSRC